MIKIFQRKVTGLRLGKLKEKDGTLVIDADFVEVMKERGLEKVTSFY